MAVGGQIGSGVKVGFASGSPHSWTKLSQILSYDSLPGIERDKVEITTHGVTSLRQFIPGLGTVTDLEFTMLADLDTTSTQFSLLDQQTTQTTYWWRVEVPNASDLSTTQYTAFTFQGKVQTWLPDAPIDDKKTLKIVILFVDNLMIQKTMASLLG
jgi:hypothetical protein